MTVPKLNEIYLDYKSSRRYTIIGMEVKGDGFYTHYRDENHKTYFCKSEAFLERFTLFNNYDSSSRNDKVV